MRCSLWHPVWLIIFMVCKVGIKGNIKPRYPLRRGALTFFWARVRGRGRGRVRVRCLARAEWCRVIGCAYADDLRLPMHAA